MFLPLIVTLIALQFLPDQVPAHYNINNQVDRWGSKYESLILPVVNIAMGYFMLGMAKYTAKREENGSNNEKICIITGLATLVLFNAMCGYFLYASFNSVDNLSSAPLDLIQLIFGLFGVMFIIVGNVMPKLKMNSMIGLRTPWSLKNEVTWKKSQHFAGITTIIAGIAMIIICFLTKDMTCAFWCMGIVFAISIIGAIYTYVVAKKY